LAYVAVVALPGLHSHARLAAVLEGDPPKDIAERLALAQRAYDTRRYALAARLWAEALDADPKLASDRRFQHPYNAACAAALAASGQGKDEPPPDDAAKARLRQQALGWLRGELSAWEPYFGQVPPQARAFVAQTLKHWQEDSDLAGVRDADALAKLPDGERATWEALWAEVDLRLRRVQDQPATAQRSPAAELPADPFSHDR
jgi:hypothetical protein